MKLNKHYFGDRIQGDRSYQEDDFGFDNGHPGDFLMILADGMGGHKGGQLASERAIQAFMDAYYVTNGNATQRLRTSLLKANEQLMLEKEAELALESMGCTLVAVAISKNTVEWVSVGDSPLWLFRNNKLQRLNADHSMKPVLKAQVEKGELTAEQAKTHPERNMLRSALTGKDIELIDQGKQPIFPGDRIVLTSDGILSLTTREIEQQLLVTNINAQQAVNGLLDAIVAKAKAGQDNTTILLANIPARQWVTLTSEHSQRLAILLFILLLHLFLFICVETQWVEPSKLLEYWLDDYQETSVSPKQSEPVTEKIDTTEKTSVKQTDDKLHDAKSSSEGLEKKEGHVDKEVDPEKPVEKVKQPEKEVKTKQDNSLEQSTSTLDGQLY